MTLKDPHNHEFLSPRSRYYGHFTPQNLAFNANLQEFSMRVNTICGLETGGKITPTEAYYQLKGLWHRLEASHAALEMTDSTFKDE
ncbi:MAG: hypothetical protein F6K42_19005 [Leptolyngbya sp. SIO1D8]|nr:hypothetical protein [Leptolyngbya sp. SIO1D8]